MGVSLADMLGTFQAPRWKRPVLLGVIFHLLFLVTTPFEHHDLACHLKTPLHCTACASSPLGSDPHALQIPNTSQLADAGQAVAFFLVMKSAVLPVRSTGRSPPASSSFA